MTVDNKSRAQHLMGTSDIDNLASAEERETARTMVSRLHVDLGHFRSSKNDRLSS